jgi:hypothetical protein
MFDLAFKSDPPLEYVVLFPRMYKAFLPTHQPCTDSGNFVADPPHHDPQTLWTSMMVTTVLSLIRLTNTSRN